MTDIEGLLSRALDDAGNGWSIGTFGAIAEFRRDDAEPAERSQRHGWTQYVTARGGIGVRTQQYATALAYDTLSSDGQTWGHTLALCLPLSAQQAHSAIVCLGVDQEPLQKTQEASLLFDLGVGRGHVSLCVRTADRQLIGVLRAAEGKALFSTDAAAARDSLLQSSPSRIALSPLGRIEVHTPIPAPGGKSPNGPHTHLLPKLMASGRAHSANTPIPVGLQVVLALHPPSPWRDASGVRTAFNARCDEEFQALLQRFGSTGDAAVRLAIEAAVMGEADPATYAWPTGRRSRVQARITLRRLAQRLGAARLSAWRALYDRSGSSEGTEDPAGADDAS